MTQYIFAKGEQRLKFEKCYDGWIEECHFTNPSHTVAESKRGKKKDLAEAINAAIARGWHLIVVSA